MVVATAGGAGPRRRHRRARRSQGSHRRRADDGARAASGARAGELARLPRHARRAVRRLRDRRRHRDAVRRSGRLQRSDRAATARVPAERRPRPRDRRAAVACGARAAGGRRRVLLLQCTVEAQSGSARPRDGDPAIANLRREAQARGIQPKRLVFAAPRPNAEYLGLYRRADLFLDTWPYGAHTTASDALWVGCPVITWRGHTFASRVAASLCVTVGLPQLVCDDAGDYCALAATLAADTTERARLRAYLEGPGRTSPLFDTARFTEALEEAYRRMVAQARAGERAAI